MNVITLTSTSVGKKALVAITGLVIFGWTLAHTAGNLQLFAGQEQFNAYAAFLKANPAVFWGQRIVLGTSVIVHTVLVLQLVAQSSRARSVGYRKQTNHAANYASLTMKFSGPAILFYILFHIAHLTAPGISFGAYEHSHTDVYSNLVGGFQVPYIAALYIIANTFLALHLYHGGYSLLRTLGFEHPRYQDRLKTGAHLLAFFIAGGNIIMPLAVLAGIIK